MTVISFAEAKAGRERTWEGKAHCVGCRHEWEAVAPLGTMWLECPECHLPKGTPKYAFGAADGDALLTCTPCGGEALTAYKRAGRFYVMCMACGNDLTNAFYEG